MFIRKTMAGSTMVEVVTGVFLIALAMALVVVVFSKTMDNSNLYVKHKAVSLVDELVVEERFKVSEFQGFKREAGLDNEKSFSVSEFQGFNSVEGRELLQEDFREESDMRIIITSEPFHGHDSLVVVVYSAKVKSTDREIYRRRLIKRVNEK